MSDKKISELPLTSSIGVEDASMLVRNDTDLQFTFATLLQFVSNNISTGASFSFGTTLPSNLTGEDGDIFVNTGASSFAQKVSGAWTVVFTIPQSTESTGNTVLYGLSAPTSSTGNNGDTYINTGNGIFYQKIADLWSQVFSMSTGPAGATGAKGADGTNGLNGKTILHGEVNPSNDLGNNGDFYLNTSTYTFFGPKASGIWPTGFSIIGLGFPSGGTTGQILAKQSNTDYDTTWIDGGFVPYTGAEQDVDIGDNALAANGAILSGGAYVTGSNPGELIVAGKKLNLQLISNTGIISTYDYDNDINLPLSIGASTITLTGEDGVTVHGPTIIDSDLTARNLSLNGYILGTNYRIGDPGFGGALLFGDSMAGIASTRFDGTEDDYVGWNYNVAGGSAKMGYYPGFDHDRPSWTISSTNYSIALLSDLSPYVPYTDADADINIGSHKLTAEGLVSTGNGIINEDGVLVTYINLGDFEWSDYIASNEYGKSLIGMNRTAWAAETDFINFVGTGETAIGGFNFINVESDGTEIVILNLHGKNVDDANVDDGAYAATFYGGVVLGSAVDPGSAPDGLFVYSGSDYQIMRRGLGDIFSDITGDVEDTDDVDPTKLITITKDGVDYKLLAIAA